MSQPLKSKEGPLKSQCMGPKGPWKCRIHIDALPIKHVQAFRFRVPVFPLGPWKFVRALKVLRQQAQKALWNLCSFETQVIPIPGSQGLYILTSRPTESWLFGKGHIDIDTWSRGMSHMSAILKFFQYNYSSFQNTTFWSTSQDNLTYAEIILNWSCHTRSCRHKHLAIRKILFTNQEDFLYHI